MGPNDYPWTADDDAWWQQQDSDERYTAEQLERIDRAHLDEQQTQTSTGD